MTTSTPTQWRRRTEHYHLERNRCDRTDCQGVFSLEYDICPYCGSTEYERAELDRTGEVVTYIVQQFLPDEFDPPMTLGIVETNDGGRVFGEILGDPDDVEIGSPVEAVVRKQKDGSGARDYTIKFTPIEEASRTDDERRPVTEEGGR